MRLSGRKPSAFTRRWTREHRVALLGLVMANIIVFAVQVVLQSYDPAFVRDYLALSQRGMREAYGWQFFTAMFLHDGQWDLLGNMLLLYLLGRDVESILGQRQFLILYFSGIIAGELGHLFLMPLNCALYAAGGGVAAVLVAYATILPELELTSMVFFVLPIRLKAKHLALWRLHHRAGSYYPGSRRHGRSQRVFRRLHRRLVLFSSARLWSSVISSTHHAPGDAPKPIVSNA